jgi:Flp pilus assembly pilin Flp
MSGVLRKLVQNEIAAASVETALLTAFLVLAVVLSIQGPGSTVNEPGGNASDQLRSNCNKKK